MGRAQWTHTGITRPAPEEATETSTRAARTTTTREAHLLGLGLDRPSDLLGLLNGRLVGLGTLVHTAEQTRRRLEGALQVACGRHAPDPDLGHVGLEGILEGNDALDHETA